MLLAGPLADRVFGPRYGQGKASPSCSSSSGAWGCFEGFPATSFPGRGRWSASFPTLRKARQPRRDRTRTQGQGAPFQCGFLPSQGKRGPVGFPYGRAPPRHGPPPPGGRDGTGKPRPFSFLPRRALWRRSASPFSASWRRGGETFRPTAPWPWRPPEGPRPPHPLPPGPGPAPKGGGLGPGGGPPPLPGGRQGEARLHLALAIALERLGRPEALAHAALARLKDPSPWTILHHLRLELLFGTKPLPEVLEEAEPFLPHPFPGVRLLVGHTLALTHLLRGSPRRAKNLLRGLLPLLEPPSLASFLVLGALALDPPRSGSSWKGLRPSSPGRAGPGGFTSWPGGLGRGMRPTSSPPTASCGRTGRSTPSWPRPA